MSALLVEPVTIDEIVGALITYRIVDHAFAAQAGQELVWWNAHAVPHAGQVATYTYTATPCTVGQVARSLTHYVYQACEGVEWADSPARAMCARLAFALLDQVPGYAEGVTR